MTQLLFILPSLCVVIAYHNRIYKRRIPLHVNQYHLSPCISPPCSSLACSPSSKSFTGFLWPLVPFNSHYAVSWYINGLHIHCCPGSSVYQRTVTYLATRTPSCHPCDSISLRCVGLAVLLPHVPQTGESIVSEEYYLYLTSRYLHHYILLTLFLPPLVLVPFSNIPASPLSCCLTNINEREYPEIYNTW